MSENLEACAEEGVVEPSSMIEEVTDIDIYEGDTLEDKIDTFIMVHGIAMFGKTYCPFCLDVKEFLSNQMGARVHVIEVDSHPQGSEIFKIVKAKTEHTTVPQIFINSEFVGGCDDIKALHAKDQLEDMLGALIEKKKSVGTSSLETSKLVPVSRGTARNPPFWFPNVVNNYVVRITGFLVFCLCIVSAANYNKTWAQYLAPGLLIDFVLRMLAGSSVSPLGMLASVVASPFRPQFRPGPPKQFAAFCGVTFSLLATIFYFVDFNGHDIAGAVILAMLAAAAGLEAFLDFCLGCVFFGFGIQYKIFPDSVYRIYTSSKQEYEDSWDYMFKSSDAPKPEKVDMDPDSPISLKYKKKSDEWTKDDFHLIRNMSVGYFAMPLAILGLSTAFKMASEWNEPYRSDSSTVSNFQVVPEAWFQTFAVIAAVVFIIMFCLYGARLFLYTHKCTTEWDCPLRSPSFGTITICFMLFAFIVYDQIDDYDPPNEGTTQGFARAIFWMGAVAHSLLTIAKMGEWIGKRLELEHVHPHWMIMPVGLSVAALCATVIPMFKVSADNNDNHAEANILVAQFFFSFAALMWITLFIITFFKVVTGHNSDNRQRHGVFIWLAAPCLIGLAQVSICLLEVQVFGESAGTERMCHSDFANFYFIGLFLFLSFLWATFPYIGFFGRDKFGMSYWMECFAFDALAACAAFFYALNGFNASMTLMIIGLSVAAIANMVAFCHTMVALIRKRGVFTPDVKWGPLSFMKLTHEAFRGNMDRIRALLEALEIKDESSQAEANLGMFAAHFNRFCIVHTEHAKHEDEVIFKTFNDFFDAHAKVFNDDHAEDHKKMEKWQNVCNVLLDTSVSIEEREQALVSLKEEIPPFFDHFLEHLKGEEDSLQPIGRKYIPLELQKQISREVFRITSAKDWEVIIPYVISNVPRHLQRVRYLKVLAWSMPERAQQIGAIVYRNVDAVMWERLRVEVPEMVPRAAPGWRRYY